MDDKIRAAMMGDPDAAAACTADGVAQDNAVLRIYNSRILGKVRIIEERDNVLFCANDVAEALGYKHPISAIKRHCRGAVKRDAMDPHGRKQATNFIPTGDLYQLIAKAELPCADGRYKHGACARDDHLYSLWGTMLHRCCNPKRKSYKRYGGRGIKVCKAWMDPNVFMDWAFANGYQYGLQLDRINNDGNYEPDNCRWATPKQNARNTSKNRHIALLGTTKTVAEWCEKFKISPYTVYWWIRTGGEEFAQQKIIEWIKAS